MENIVVSPGNGKFYNLVTGKELTPQEASHALQVTCNYCKKVVLLDQIHLVPVTIDPETGMADEEIPVCEDCLRKGGAVQFQEPQNWERYKAQMFYHYAPVWYEGKPAYFVKLQDDNQQLALIDLDNKIITVDRDTLTPRPTKQTKQQGSPYDGIVHQYAKEKAYRDFLESTVDDAGYNAYLEYIATPRPEEY